MEDKTLVRQWTGFKKEILAAADWAVKMIGSDRKGGYFTLVDYETGDVLIPPTIIGEITNGKGDKYKSYCQEKANRLLSVTPALVRLVDVGFSATPVPYLTNGVQEGLTSSELRDETREQWGGAILTLGISEHPLIFSFSGLTEMQDEAVSIMIASKADVVSTGPILKLARRIDNNIVLNLL